MADALDLHSVLGILSQHDNDDDDDDDGNGENDDDDDGDIHVRNIRIQRIVVNIHAKIPTTSHFISVIAATAATDVVTDSPPKAHDYV